VVLLPGIAAGPPSSIGPRDTSGKQGSRKKREEKLGREQQEEG